jgi:hypothetical protein
LLIPFLFAGIDSLSQTIDSGSPFPSQAYVAGSTAVIVAPNLTISGTGNISSATVSIQSYQFGDALSYSGLPAGVSASWNGTQKILTFQGSAPITDYQTLLRSVTFSTSTNIQGSRRIDFILGLAVSYMVGPQEHLYQIVTGAKISWAAAKSAAESSTIGSYTGYLATITSAEENEFISTKITGNTWIGASDDPTYTGNPVYEWYWVSGPENGTHFFTQTGFHPGTGGGTAIGGLYNNWASGEPNDNPAVGHEYYAHYWGPSNPAAGQWNDFANTQDVYSYVVEYGGYGAASLDVSDYATVDVYSPFANNDSYYIYENTTRSVPDAASVGLLSNDTDPHGTGITVNPTAGITVHYGSITVNSNGSFSYTPNLNFTSNDYFDYRCWDGTVGDYARCYLYVRTPQYTGSGFFNEAGKWNGAYVPPNIDTDMDIIVSGTMTTTTNLNVFSLTVNGTMTANHTVNTPTLIINGTLNVNNNITVDNLTIHTNSNINFSNDATITVNNSISNQTRTGMQISAPVVLHSGVKIH